MKVTLNWLKQHVDFNWSPGELTGRLAACRLSAVSVCLMACVFFAFAARSAGVTWICSTEAHPWQTMPSPAFEQPQSDVPPQVRIVSHKKFQTIDGFGGCFNELSWVALDKASESDRNRVLAALFGQDGCAFNMGRIPIGANDFALDWYSLDETPGDLTLTNFSIARDEKFVIPFIKAAMAVRPDLSCWGSAWSPPSWMKSNANYSKGSLKWEPGMLQTYATYLARWVEEYRKAGVKVFAVFPQNEPNILNVYPTCEWTGPQMREFIADYLGPTLRQRKTNVELWLGTLNGDPSHAGDNANARLETVLDDPKANRFITGVSFQYDSKNLPGAASLLYPDKKLMQSETECNNGNNSWTDAQRLFGLMRHYLENGVSSYFAWNMVLNETGLSSWNWRQNALITMDQHTGQVTFNGEYFVMRHFSQFVKPGAKRVLTTGVWGDQIAFVNPDGSTVLVIGNFAKQALPVRLNISERADGNTLNVILPAHSMNTFVIPAK
jgi:glucosylceramidase